jgi:hypothetical protein
VTTTTIPAKKPAQTDPASQRLRYYIGGLAGLGVVMLVASAVYWRRSRPSRFFDEEFEEAELGAPVPVEPAVLVAAPVAAPVDTLPPVVDPIDLSAGPAMINTGHPVDSPQAAELRSALSAIPDLAPRQIPLDEYVRDSLPEGE